MILRRVIREGVVPEALPNIPARHHRKVKYSAEDCTFTAAVGTDENSYWRKRKVSVPVDQEILYAEFVDVYGHEYSYEGDDRNNWPVGSCSVTTP